MRLTFPLFRIGFGLYLAIVFTQIGLYRSELLSERTIFSGAPTGLSPVLSLALTLTIVAAALLFMVGAFRKTAAAMLVVGWAFLKYHMQIPVPSDGYIGWLLLASIFVPSGEPLSIGLKDLAWHLPGWICESAWIVMGLSYTASGFDKAASPLWTSGHAIGLVAASPVFLPGPVRTALLGGPAGLVKWLTYSALGLEVIFFPLCLVRDTRALAWFAMTAMHLTSLVFFNVREVSLMMLLSQLFLFNPQFLRRSAWVNWPTIAVFLVATANLPWLIYEFPGPENYQAYGASVVAPGHLAPVPEVYCGHRNLGAYGTLTKRGSSSGGVDRPQSELDRLISAQASKTNLLDHGVAAFSSSTRGEATVANRVPRFRPTKEVALCLAAAATPKSLFLEPIEFDLRVRPSPVDPFDGGPGRIGKDEPVEAVFIIPESLPVALKKGPPLDERIRNALLYPSLLESLSENINDDYGHIFLGLAYNLRQLAHIDRATIDKKVLSWHVDISGRFRESNRPLHVQIFWGSLQIGRALNPELHNMFAAAARHAHFLALLSRGRTAEKLYQSDLLPLPTAPLLVPYQAFYFGAVNSHSFVPPSWYASLARTPKGSVRDLVTRGTDEPTNFLFAVGMLGQLEQGSQSPRQESDYSGWLSSGMLVRERFGGE